MFEVLFTQLLNETAYLKYVERLVCIFPHKSLKVNIIKYLLVTKVTAAYIPILKRRGFSLVSW